jgi:hypothetical protein
LAFRETVDAIKLPRSLAAWLAYFAPSFFAAFAPFFFFFILAMAVFLRLRVDRR